MIRGRLAPAAVFPAGDARFHRSEVCLPSGLRLRVVECVAAVGAHLTSAVVCLHGWGGSSYTYRDLLPLLVATGSRAITFDLPGHGFSDKPIDPVAYTVDRMVGYIVEALDVLGLEQAMFVGHSMGGTIAARLAVVHPERVEGLVLCAPMGFGYPPQLRLAVWATPAFLAGVLPHVVPRWSVAALLHAAYGTLRAPTPRDYNEYWAPTQFPEFAQAMRLLLHVFDWRIGDHAELDGIAAPVTVLYGSRDRLVTERSVRRYVDVIPKARLVCVEGSGHVLPAEAPDAVAAAVVRQRTAASR